MINKTKGPGDVADKISASWLQMEREKSQLVAAINGLTIGFMITDDHNNIVAANPAAEKILEKQGEGWNLSQIQTHIKSAFDVVKAANDSLNNKKNIESGFVSFGSRFVKFFITPIEVLKEGLAVLGTTIIVEDATEEKLQNDKQLDFLSIATHQIKAPLTIIRGDTDLLLKTYPNLLKEADYKKLVADIQEEALSAISIAHDFLNMARLEEGKVEFKKQVFSLPALVEEIIKNFQTITKVKGIGLVLEPYKPDLPQANADPEAIKHVLFNLIDNAIKFTQKGSISINIEAQPEVLNVRVKDTGPGIPKEVQEHLFEKFMGKNSQKSSGLGLYIAKLFTQNTGGKISLEKSDESGTTFLFTVPQVNPTSGSIVVSLEG